MSLCISSQTALLPNGRSKLGRVRLSQSNRRIPKFSLRSSASTELQNPKDFAPGRVSFPILVNGCAGKMGKAVAEAVVSAGLGLIPITFSAPSEVGQTVQIGTTEVQIHGLSEREDLLSSVYNEHPDVIVVDFTVPDAVNENADLYCKIGVPFVMGTTGGDRVKLYETVKDSNVYAVISPQMGKQVVAFLAAMEIMADQFPGAFSGYTLQVKESHQVSKVDTSGTAKSIVSCFQKLGVSFDVDQVCPLEWHIHLDHLLIEKLKKFVSIELIRDPQKQLEMVGVPEEYLAGHAFHMYHLTSPDQTVSFEFQHNVCGRSIYAEGSVDAAMFLANKVLHKADKRIYDMIDVLREGNMR